MSITSWIRSITAGISRTFGFGGGDAGPADPTEGEGSPVGEEQIDPTHAPGHQHLGPPPQETAPPVAKGKAPRNQPWVRTTHSDSQKRRPRG